MRKQFQNLLTFLIVYVSGVKPLEEKSKRHPDFKAYAEKTPSLIPFSLVNGLLYGAAWFILVSQGAYSSAYYISVIALVFFAIQVLLFSRFDKKSLRICFPLSIFALFLGFLQEMVFIHLGVLAYSDAGAFPPHWILALYVLFSLTLNSSLEFLNKNLVITFLLGGVGGVFSYISGERLGAVKLVPPLVYPSIFFVWGLFLTILIVMNRKLRKCLIK